MEVFSPGSKNLQTFMMNRLLVHMCREFQAAEKQHLSPYIRIDYFLSQFPFLSEASFRKRIKEYANLQVLMVHRANSMLEYEVDANGIPYFFQND